MAKVKLKINGGRFSCEEGSGKFGDILEVSEESYKRFVKLDLVGDNKTLILIDGKSKVTNNVETPEMIESKRLKELSEKENLTNKEQKELDSLKEKYGVE